MKNKGHSTTETFIEWIIGIIIVAILFGVFLFGADKAFDSYEKQYCYKLQDQAEQYKNYLYSHENQQGFFITQSDKDMCENIYNIEINAPVK
jgi:hypothetical protein